LANGDSTTNIVLVGVLLLIILAMNARATILVVRDDLSESSQRTAQLLLVWLAPVIGALVVFAVHRKEEPPSRKYKEERNIDDDGLPPRAGGRSRSHDEADDD